MRKLLTIKYVECKCIRSTIGNPKDLENLEQEIIKDIKGFPILNVYRNYCKCDKCKENSKKIKLT